MKIVHEQKIDRNGLESLVFMDEYTQGEHDQATTALSACWGLIAHNAQTKQGLVGHFIEDYELFTEAIADTTQLGSIRDTNVWIGGASHVSTGRWGDSAETLNFQVGQDREFVLGELAFLADAGLSPDNLFIMWGETNSATDARLYVAEGVLVIASSTAE